MQVNARGFTFDIDVAGPDTGVPALLLHGFPQHSRQWDLVAPLLHRHGVRTAALDQRGYSPGARPGEVGAYRIGECVADAAAVLDELGWDSAHVIGHDWGAVVGWHLAGSQVARVRSLTAVSVPHPVALATALATDADQRTRSAYIGLFQQEGHAERLLLDDDARRLRSLLAGVPTDRVELYVQRMREPGALTAALNWYRAMSAADLAGLAPVKVPTTFVWSDADAAIGRTAAEACAAQVTGAYRFVEVPGVSHWLPEEAPQVVAEAAAALIR
jgi:pimeloyl-ACP methyl ester carboxylesterase